MTFGLLIIGFFTFRPIFFGFFTIPLLGAENPLGTEEPLGAEDSWQTAVTLEAEFPLGAEDLLETRPGPKNKDSFQF